MGLDRLLFLPGYLQGYGWVDELGTGLGLTLLAATLLSGLRPSREKVRWIPLAVAVVAYMAFPLVVRNVGYLFPRFAVLVIPAALIALEDGWPVQRPWIARLAVIGATLVSLSLTAIRFHGFNEEAAGFDALVARMPPAMRVRPIIVERESAFVPGYAPFLHFVSYYQAEKGGWVGSSFARYYWYFARYRQGIRWGMQQNEEWFPRKFNAAVEVPQYDYFVVRAEENYGPVLFYNTPTPIELHAREGLWWGYRPVREQGSNP